MDHRLVARALLAASREMLIEHVDGTGFVGVPVIAGGRTKTRHALLNLGLIRYGDVGRDGIVRGTYGSALKTARPTTTHITDDGRMVLAVVLAAYAEALIRAGYGVSEKKLAAA